jgi:2,5-diamino-6-(ribosylamino)-4(3H)-pyrimidinone 5'-phosphate reductase
MLPRVVLHNETSVDGRLDWLTVDMGLYYGLAERWQADAMLSGSNTLLNAYPAEQLRYDVVR